MSIEGSSSFIIEGIAVTEPFATTLGGRESSPGAVREGTGPVAEDGRMGNETDAVAP